MDLLLVDAEWDSEKGKYIGEIYDKTYIIQEIIECFEYDIEDSHDKDKVACKHIIEKLNELKLLMEEYMNT